MDSRSHVEYALKILPTHLNHFSVGSLFPQIDRTPATLHRNYAHHIHKAVNLSELGLKVLSGVITSPENYEKKRFLAERDRIISYFTNLNISTNLNQESLDATVCAFISHLHLDTFNQPVQAFTPLRAVCSGQWKLWDKIGDFRYRLYVDGVVENLREEWMKSEIWNTKFDVKTITTAFVYRLNILSTQQVSEDHFNKSLKALGLEPINIKHPSIQWLEEMENELSELHLQYLS